MASRGLLPPSEVTVSDMLQLVVEIPNTFFVFLRVISWIGCWPWERHDPRNHTKQGRQAEACRTLRINLNTW
jgi:hypothetical protein